VRKNLREAFILRNSPKTAMFCPKCGAQNDDGVSYCAKCGNALQTSGTQQPGSYSVGTPNPPPAKVGRSAILAAILNLFFGVGYLYLSYKKVMGLPTIVFVVVAFIVFAVVSFFTFGLGAFLLAVILAIDGYQKGTGARGFVPAE
jgi:hypothetical protein